jgi:signal transduction histidine kinase
MNRERREIIYSIITIILIPLLFVFNTVLITNKIQDDTNRNVRRNADEVNGVLAESLRSSIEFKNYILATGQIRAVNKQQPSIGSIFVVTRSNDKYTVVANTAGAPTTLNHSDSLQLSIVFDRARSVAERIDLHSSDGSITKGWHVITPLVGSNQSVEAAVSTNVSTSDTQSLIDSTLSTSFVVTGISVVFILVLLFRHFRFAGYADLLRKQKMVNQTMTDFLSVATHELKAPMTVTKGYIANILEGDYGVVSQQIVEPLNTVMAQTDRLNSLVQDLLNVSHIEQGKITVTNQVVVMKPIIVGLLHDYTERAQAKGLQLVYNPPSDPKVFADPGRVQEIMTNLIDNAIKYTPSGTVTITHRQHGNMTITSVVDTGPGMTSEESDRLFQRFYRVKNDSTQGIPGTGLGLWIIKQYITLMNGKITVNSIVGVGTEFTVELPSA